MTEALLKEYDKNTPSNLRRENLDKWVKAMITNLLRIIGIGGTPCHVKNYHAYQFVATQFGDCQQLQGLVSEKFHCLPHHMTVLVLKMRGIVPLNACEFWRQHGLPEDTHTPEGRRSLHVAVQGWRSRPKVTLSADIWTDMILPFIVPESEQDKQRRYDGYSERLEKIVAPLKEKKSRISAVCHVTRDNLQATIDAEKAAWRQWKQAQEAQHRATEERGKAMDLRWPRTILKYGRHSKEQYLQNALMIFETSNTNIAGNTMNNAMHALDINTNKLRTLRLPKEDDKIPSTYDAGRLNRHRYKGESNSDDTTVLSFLHIGTSAFRQCVSGGYRGGFKELKAMVFFFVFSLLRHEEEAVEEAVEDQEEERRRRADEHYHQHVSPFVTDTFKAVLLAYCNRPHLIYFLVLLQELRKGVYGNESSAFSSTMTKRIELNKTNNTTLFDEKQTEFGRKRDKENNAFVELQLDMEGHPKAGHGQKIACKLAELMPFHLISSQRDLFRFILKCFFEHPMSQCFGHDIVLGEDGLPIFSDMNYWVIQCYDVPRRRVHHYDTTGLEVPLPDFSNRSRCYRYRIRYSGPLRKPVKCNVAYDNSYGEEGRRHNKDYAYTDNVWSTVMRDNPWIERNGLSNKLSFPEGCGITKETTTFQDLIRICGTRPRIRLPVLKRLRVWNDETGFLHFWARDREEHTMVKPMNQKDKLLSFLREKWSKKLVDEHLELRFPAGFVPTEETSFLDFFNFCEDNSYSPEIRLPRLLRTQVKDSRPYHNNWTDHFEEALPYKTNISEWVNNTLQSFPADKRNVEVQEGFVYDEEATIGDYVKYLEGNSLTDKVFPWFRFPLLRHKLPNRVPCSPLQREQYINFQVLKVFALLWDISGMKSVRLKIKRGKKYHYRTHIEVPDRAPHSTVILMEMFMLYLLRKPYCRSRSFGVSACGAAVDNGTDKIARLLSMGTEDASNMEKDMLVFVKSAAEMNSSLLERAMHQMVLPIQHQSSSDRENDCFLSVFEVVIKWLQQNARRRRHAISSSKALYRYTDVWDTEVFPLGLQWQVEELNDSWGGDRDRPVTQITFSRAVRTARHFPTAPIPLVEGVYKRQLFFLRKLFELGRTEQQYSTSEEGLSLIIDGRYDMLDGTIQCFKTCLCTAYEANNMRDGYRRRYYAELGNRLRGQGNHAFPMLDIDLSDILLSFEFSRKNIRSGKLLRKERKEYNTNSTVCRYIRDKERARGIVPVEEETVKEPPNPFPFQAYKFMRIADVSEHPVVYKRRNKYAPAVEERECTARQRDKLLKRKRAAQTAAASALKRKQKRQRKK